jgi:hypothetical protein
VVCLTLVWTHSTGCYWIVLYILLRLRSNFGLRIPSSCVVTASSRLHSTLLWVPAVRVSMDRLPSSLQRVAWLLYADRRLLGLISAHCVLSPSCRVPSRGAPSEEMESDAWQGDSPHINVKKRSVPYLQLRHRADCRLCLIGDAPDWWTQLVDASRTTWMLIGEQCSYVCPRHYVLNLLVFFTL